MPSPTVERNDPRGTTAPIEEIAILWLSAGVSCDGDTIAMTAATQPSIEDVITKIELADAVEFSRESAERNIQSIRPGMQMLMASAKTGEGMPEFLGLLESRLAETRALPR